MFMNPSSILNAWRSLQRQNVDIATRNTDFRVKCFIESLDVGSKSLYWLPKLHKKTYKARFIANSSSCTTTELSKLLTSCLTAVKNHVIRYCEKVYERSAKHLFWSIKKSGEVLNKLKSIPRDQFVNL